MKQQTQKQLREVWKLPFCYLCGQAFVPDQKRSRDHVPPRAIFAEADRDPPLILPTHQTCNEAQSGYDELVGQLIAPIHGKYPAPEHQKLNVGIVGVNQNVTPFLVFRGIDLCSVINRWIRAFHSALYQEFLPMATKNYVHPPFPVGQIRENGEVAMEQNPLQQQFLFVEEIKRNRIARNLDSIKCNNSKCIYECVWQTTDHGQSMCIWGLQLYDWKTLGDSQHFRQRGCVGMYMPSTGRPASGARATNLEFKLPTFNPLDAFSD